MSHLFDLTELNSIAPRYPNGSNTDGFQEAHGIGAGFAETRLRELNELLGVSANDYNGTWNLSHTPDTEAGGLALGSGVHRGNHVAAYDKLAYDYDDLENSDKYLNVLQRETRDAGEALELERETATPFRQDRGCVRMIGFLGRISAVLGFAGLASATCADLAAAQEITNEVVTVDVAGFQFDLPLHPILRISDLKREMVFDGRFDNPQEKLSELSTDAPIKVHRFTYYLYESNGQCAGPEWLIEACAKFSGLRETVPPISVAYLQVSRKLRDDIVIEKPQEVAFENMSKMRTGERAYMSVPTHLDVFMSECSHAKLGLHNYHCSYIADFEDAIRIRVVYFVQEGYQGEISAVISNIEQLFTEKLLKSQP